MDALSAFVELVARFVVLVLVVVALPADDDDQHAGPECHDGTCDNDTGISGVYY